MAWSPWIELGEYQYGNGFGIYPQYWGGWYCKASARYPEDTTYFEGRSAAAWGAAKGAIDIPYGLGWSFANNASGIFTGSFYGSKHGSYQATMQQGVQIIRLAPSDALLDLILEAQWQLYVTAQGLVKGTDYDTPPAASQYKTYDWVPMENTAEVLPGGYLGLAQWPNTGGTSGAETDGYWGHDFELRTWHELDFGSLPFQASNVAGNPIYDLGASVGSWPGHYTSGTALFTWGSLSASVLDGDANPVVHYSQPDVLHAMDLQALAINGHIGFIHTSSIFEGGLPNPTPGTTRPADGALMGAGGANSYNQSDGSRVVPRAYPLVLLPDIKYWKTIIPPLRLRARDDDTGTPTSGAEPSPRILVREGGMRDHTASIQQSRRLFYGPGTYA